MGNGTKIKDIKDIISSNQSAIVVFTRGPFLNLRKGDVSESGIWKVDKSRKVDKIVIYYRHDGVNEIIIGKHIDTVKSNIKGRYYLLFRNYHSAGFTPNNWKVFAQTGSHPVRYF